MLKKGDYIRIVNDSYEYFGYITAIQVNEFHTRIF